MSAPLPARQHAGSNSSHHPEAPPPLTVPSIPSHESRVTRGRALTTSSRSASPRSHTPGAGAGPLKHGASPDGGLERKTSLSYGHHRNTSIVHGKQHSRNTSLAHGASPSSLVPQAPIGSGATALIDGPHVIMDEGKEKQAIGVLPSINGSTRHVAQSSLSTTYTADSLSGQRKVLERMHSKSKRDPHHRSQSRHQPHELKTVGEYALHHLFNAFVAQADQKIALCANEPTKPEPRVERHCGPGVDANFDQLITALGHIARQKPKPLIDTLMFWRKAKSEEANQARNDLNQVRSPVQVQTPGLNGFPRRNTEPMALSGDVSTPIGVASTPADLMTERQIAVIQAERRSTVSIYILCRVLMEIIGQSTLECITVDMAERLEDIIYSQLKAADPETLEDSPLRHANWVIFGQLLGVMSAINFNSVSRRFIHDLDKKELSAKGLVLVVRGMRYLKLDHSTPELWKRSCEFMQVLSRLFTEAHGQPLKYAYCQLFKELLFPIAAQARSELNDQNWRQAIEIMRPRISGLLAKPRHWHEAYPLTAAMLCTSPVELFSLQWLQTALSCQSRLKERMSRATSLRSICRLVWTYLYRMPSEPQTNMVKKLDDVTRMIFIPGRRSYLSTEPSIAEPLIQLIRIIGYKFQEYCFRTIIFPLLNADQLEKQLRVETLEPERMAIGIRAFLAIMTDLERGERPPFPTSFDSDPYTGFHEMPALPNSPKPPIIVPPKSSFKKEERLSKPVLLTGFNEVSRESYARFCKVLGEIAVICDVTFGGQAVLDEKLAAQIPKTPMADAFSSLTRREETQSAAELKQSFYDLLHVAVQALPRCLPSHIPFNTILNLLCTGTAHVQRTIATSSAQSLKSIARQSHAQQVTMGFARYIFNFDDRYATMSDGGMLGQNHIENTLRLYVELLEIWIDEVRLRSRKASTDLIDEEAHGKRSAGLDNTNIKALVDEIESHGLFFLCSPSRRVRSYAVKVLRLATDFDAALGASSTRIIRIMEEGLDKVINVNDDKLTLAERSRLQRGLKKSNNSNTLIELCSEDPTYESTLWFKVFPNLIKISHEICQITVTLTRVIICARLSQVQTIIESLAEGPRANQYAGFEPGSNRSVSRLASTSPELVIEQWKLYLIFACTTLTSVGTQQFTMIPASQHARKASKASQKGTQRLEHAEDLFEKVLRFLGTSNSTVRDATVVGLGSININLYKALLIALQAGVDQCNKEARARVASHQRTPSNARRTLKNDILRTEIAHVYKLTATFLRDSSIRSDADILSNLVGYSKDLRLFLNDVEVQSEWDFQKLRTHYCGLMEELYNGINKTSKPLLWMPFQSRKAAFALMEDWCGFSPNQQQVRQREDQMRRSMLDREDFTNKGVATAAMEIEKRDLRTAALGAMAALCGGPLSIVTDSKVSLSFDFARMLSWIEMMFDAPSDRTHAIGRRALKNLIEHNPDHPRLLSHMIDKCYTATTSKALESYFDVVSQVLVEFQDISLPFWKVLSAGLHTLGHENNQLRIKSLRLMRRMEERHGRNSKLQDLDISVSDKTIAVYKDAQFQISKRLAQTHPDLALHVFSEFASHFSSLKPDHQRIMVAAMLPWIQAIELQLDKTTEGPTVGSYVTLANLFEITVRCGSTLHNEIQALWQALATGPHAGNVQLILDFFINLCLEKREQIYVDYAKQIVVYLSSTLAGSKVIEFLLLQINPRAMLEGKRETSVAPIENTMLPYFADLSVTLPSSNRPYSFTLGMLCLILLVDLIVSPIQLPKEHVPLLLEVSLVLWDHHIPLVQDQARELLVHLIHELVISKIEDQNASVDKRAIEDFVESIRRNEPKVLWPYEDNSGKDAGELTQDRVPEALNYVANEVVKIFSITYPGIQEEWGRVTLSWATSCHVRHLACRSMQLFRSIPSFLDQGMLADIFARLSNTISDEAKDLQVFTMEILISLRRIIEYLDADGLLHYPQLFWATCACLNTMHEQEFIESMSMLDKLLEKLDLSNPGIIDVLSDAKPDSWEGNFDGLSCLLYKGARSSLCLERTLSLLERISCIPPNDLVGDESRLPYALLANLPRFLRSFDHDVEDEGCSALAMKLATLAQEQNHTDLVEVLEHFAAHRYRKDQDFLAQAVSALSNAVFPDFEFKALTFLIGLLTNKLSWIKIKTMQVLCVLIPEVDMRRTEISSKGSDLISPLLKLLQTEYCPYALEVLDHVLNVASIAGPLDKAHLRMSMAGSHSTRAFRSQFNAVQSLYGMPEESGWSIPAPAIVSGETRENVYKVWSACAPATSTSEPRTATPKIEFHVEEYPFTSYTESRTTTMTSGITPDDGHIEELVLKLNDLDDFFGDDDDDGVDGATSMANSPVLGHGPLEARENIYDQQTLPLLHKSLTRNASVTSFQTGFSDLRTPLHNPGIMTPTAFTLTSPSLQTSIPPTRPGLHARSITSPANNLLQRTPPGGSFSFDETEESFSDDDIAVRGTAQDKPFFLENMIKPMTQGAGSRFRSGMRRLTGSNAEAKEREKTKEMIRREAMQRSPQVPKVPDMYLRDPKSNEM